MNIEIIEPSKDLQGIVKNYLVVNSLDDIQKMIFLPTGGNFIIFNRGVDINIKLYTNDVLYSVPKTYSVGLKTSKAKYVFEAKYKNDINLFPIIIVELSPMGHHKLFNEDLSSLDFGYMDMDKETVNNYFSKLYTHSTTEDEIAYINSSLKRLEQPSNDIALALEKIIHRIHNDYHLDISIDDLLQEFNYTRSTLERHFKKIIGLTPKQFIYVSKFCRTILAYIDGKKSLNEIQYIYSDNSHMNSVFKKFLGVSPSEVFSKIEDGEFEIYQILKLNRQS